MGLPDDDLLTESVDVVLLESTGSGLAPIGGGPVVDPDAPDAPTPDVVAALLDAAVSLRAPQDLDLDVVRAIARWSVPASFRQSPWLREHRELVFVEGSCRIGQHVVRYEKHRGVYVDEPDTHRTVAGASRVTPRPRVSRESTTASFDLISEPWIPVAQRNGVTEHVGLRQLFEGAHLIRRLAGETPPMTAALYRLLLALFHRAYGPGSDEHWAALWNAQELPLEALDAYLTRYQDRFDLFHPTLPFLQCPALATLTPTTPGKLVPHRAAGNNVTLFDHTTSSDVVTLTPAEAACWLVTVQSFDPGGMKTPFEKEKSSERAPCNDFGVVVVEGGDLKQTLLLNAVVYRPDAELARMTTSRDAPAWEQDPPSPHPSRRTVLGWTDLLTWPSRRILLTAGTGGGETVVTGVAITPGTRLDVVPLDEELMAAYRRRSDRMGRPKPGAPMLPIRLRPVRGVWRHSVELLITDTRQEDRHRQRPRALDQLANFAERDLFPAGTVHTLRVFGQQLDSKASVVEAALEEAMPMPVALLRAQDESLGGLIGAAIAYADELGSALRSLQSEFRKEMQAKAAESIELWYWPRLSRPFAVFLTGLSTDREAKRSETGTAQTWSGVVGRIARSAAERWLADSPADTRVLLALGKHHGRFLGRIGKASETFRAQVDVYSTGSEATHARCD